MQLKRIKPSFTELFADESIETPGSINYLLSPPSSYDRFGWGVGSGVYRFGHGFYDVGE